MRDAFINAVYELAMVTDNLMLLSGDIGYKVFDYFRRDFPRKFFNVGIAEQNMIGMSAGLAMNGKLPFVYTIIPFLTMRAFEQIRVDLCMHNLPVKLIGVGGGLAYGMLGPTHHAIEDVAIMRALPNMTVIVPADPAETYELTRAAMNLKGPCYIRLGKNGEPVLPARVVDDRITIGKARMMRDGSDATIIACGPITGIAIAAAEELSRVYDFSCRVLSMHTIKPIDDAAIWDAVTETRAILTLEEHSIIGGLGSAVAEHLAENSSKIPFSRMGIKDRFTTTVGDQNYLLAQHGLTIDAVIDQVLSLLGEAK